MPHRKLVKIGDTPKLPTIMEFFSMMAERQRDEIRKLKEELAGQNPTEASNSSTHDPRKPAPDPWLLHPVRIKRAPAKKAAKKSVKRRKSAKKVSKKSASKRASARKPARKIAKKKTAKKK